MLLLVTGTGRCGSTLLTELLARHPETGFVSGVDDKLPRLNLLGRFNGPLYRRSAPRPATARALADIPGIPGPRRLRVAPSEAWRLLERRVGPALVKPCRDLAAADLTPDLRRRLREFFTTRADAQHAAVFVQHPTGWPRTEFIRAALPDVRIIHLVRDGRAVANSMLQMGWWDGWRGPRNWYLGPLPPAPEALWEATGRSFAALAGIGWSMLEDAYDTARACAPTGQWLDLRYEDLLAHPEATLGTALEFAGLSWTRTFDAGYRRHRLEPSRGHSYRHQLTDRQITDIETVAGRQLDRWGYRPATPAEPGRSNAATPSSTDRAMAAATVGT